MAPQIIKDKKGKKIAVVLSIEDYEKLLEERDELEAVKAYDRAKNRKESHIPLREAIRQRKQKKHG